MNGTRIGVYPGTFDPITNGHMDIIRRSMHVVDRLVIGVAVNAGKGPLFGLDERMEMVRQDVGTNDAGFAARADIRPLDNLLMDFVVQNGGTLIVRGLRAVSDFEYEFQMAGMNARLNPDVETVFLMASEGNHFIASRLVKEIAILGGDISSFVSKNVRDRLVEKVKDVD